MDILFNSVGILGVICLLLAYAMLQIGKWDEHGYSFQLTNLIGALAIIISLFHDWNLPQFLLEAAWVAISLYGMIKSHKSNRIVDGK